MANENDIPLNITADTEAAQKNLEQFTAAITKLMGSLNQSIDNGISKPLDNVAKNSKKSSDQITSFFSNIKVAAAAAFAVFAGKEVLGFFSDAIKEGAEADKVLEKFNFTLAATGEYSAESSKGLQKYAAAIQENTTFTDDAVLNALTLAKTFGLTNEAAKGLVDAAINLAAVQGTDLATATDKLLNSLNGQGRALKDLGPQFANLTTDQLKSGEAIKLVEKRFGDAARTLTSTFAGATTQAGNAFSEFQETVGKVITNSPDVIKAIQAIAKIFNIFADAVSKNESGFSKFLTFLVKATAETADLVVNSFAIITTGFLELGKAIGKGASLVEAAFKGLSGDTKGARLALQDFAVGGNSFVRTLDGVEMALDKAAKITRETADSIGNIGDKSVKSDEALKKISATADKSKGAFGKLREEALKFTEELALRSADAFDKLTLQRQKDLKEISKYLKDGSLTFKEAADARVRIEKDFSTKTKEIRDKDLKEAQAAIDKFNDDYAKSLEDRKKLIEGAFKDPIQAAINFDTSSGSAKQVGAAIGLGIVSEMLNGAKGAQKILSAGIGAAAEAFLPGFGGAIGQLADQLLTLGPEGAKAMVREFVDALPELIIRLADSIPAVVDALVDSLITKGGIVKIAIALARAIPAATIGRAIAKELGTEASKEFIAGLQKGLATFGAKLSDYVKSSFSNVGVAIREGVVSSAKLFVSTIIGSISGIGAAIAASIGSVLIQAFSVAGPLLSNPLSATLDRISGLAPELGRYLSGALDRIRDLAPLLGNYLSGALDRIEGLANYFADKVKGAVNAATGGGGGGVVSTVKKAVGLATGGLVPPGYNNDTFPARLSSGELVIPKDLVGSLSDFLDVGLSPKSDSGDINTALLGKIAALLGQPINVESSINISGQAFADIILKLSRNNARLSA